MSQMIPNPQTNIPDGAGQISAPPTDDPNLYIDPVQSFALPQQYMLPNSIDNQIQQGAPLGAFTDSQYLADEAGLRNQIAQQYADLLQQLGYTDPTSGRVIPGRMIQDANIQMAQYQQAMQDAARQVTQNAQQGGTVFSGIRAQQLEQAQRPSVQGMSALTLNTGRNLADLYSKAQLLASNYNTQNNQYLAQAAQRQAAALMAAPPVINIYGGGTAPVYGPTQGGTVGGTGPGGDVTPTDLQDVVSTPDDSGVYPASDQTPYAVGGTAAPPGGYSATDNQGVFAVDLGNMDYPAPAPPKPKPSAPLSGYAQQSTANLH